MEKEKANWVKIAEEFAKGEGNLQLAVKTKLKKRGIKCDDAAKAQSILEIVKCSKGEGQLQLAAKTNLKKRGIECANATKAQGILNSINNSMKNPASCAKVAAANMGALNPSYEGDKWSPGEVIASQTMQGTTQYYEDCRDNEM